MPFFCPQVDLGVCADQANKFAAEAVASGSNSATFTNSGSQAVFNGLPSNFQYDTVYEVTVLPAGQTCHCKTKDAQLFEGSWSGSPAGASSYICVVRTV